jgi:hypothetical protein
MTLDKTLVITTPAALETRACRSPNFLIAGAGESGTSWLSACLMAHPEIYLPPNMRPEPHFFYKQAEYAQGWDYYLERYFAQVPESSVAVGERSSSYIFSPQAIARMVEALPTAKIIVMLREPVERAYSNWRFTVQSGLEVESFERSIALEPRRIAAETNPLWREIQPYAYLGRSRYGEQIECLMAHYPASQVLLLNADRVKQDEPEALARVCRFLGVSDTIVFPTPGTFPTASVRSRRLQRLLRGVYGRTFDAAIENTRLAIPNSDARKPGWDWLLKANLTSRHPTLHPATRARLQHYFADSNQRLAPFIDWDPQHW